MKFLNNPNKDTITVYKCLSCDELFPENPGNTPTRDIREHGMDEHFPKWDGYEKIVGYPKEEL